MNTSKWNANGSVILNREFTLRNSLGAALMTARKFPCVVPIAKNILTNLEAVFREFYPLRTLRFPRKDNFSHCDLEKKPLPDSLRLASAITVFCYTFLAMIRIQTKLEVNTRSVRSEGIYFTHPQQSSKILPSSLAVFETINSPFNRKLFH